MLHLEYLQTKNVSSSQVALFVCYILTMHIQTTFYCRQKHIPVCTKVYAFLHIVVLSNC